MHYTVIGSTVPFYLGQGNLSLRSKLNGMSTSFLYDLYFLLITFYEIGVLFSSIWETVFRTTLVHKNNKKKTLSFLLVLSELSVYLSCFMCNQLTFLMY